MPGSSPARPRCGRSASRRPPTGCPIEGEAGSRPGDGSRRYNEGPPPPPPRGEGHVTKGPPQWVAPFRCLVDDLAAGRGNRLRELREHLERLLAELLVVVEPGPGGDQLADDYVLLQAAQPVDLAGDRCLGQHPGRFLEG